MVTIKICVMFFFPIIVVLLALASVLFVIRIILVVWRHIKQPLYEDVGSEALEVLEIAVEQRKIFRWVFL